MGTGDSKTKKDAAMSQSVKSLNQPLMYRMEEDPDPVADLDMVAGLPDRSIGYLVRDVHRAFYRMLQNRITAYGVTMGHWFFLRALWDEDGLTQRELSQRVGMMEPTTVTALNSMERRGLVERVRNPHDRRKVNIFLTAKGRSLRDVLLPCAADVSGQATRGIAAENLATAVDVLTRLTRNLGEEH